MIWKATSNLIRSSLFFRASCCFCGTIFLSLFLLTRAFQLGTSFRRVFFGNHHHILKQYHKTSYTHTVPVKHGQHYLIIVNVSWLPQIAFMKGKKDVRERCKHTVECHLPGWFWLRQFICHFLRLDKFLCESPSQCRVFCVCVCIEVCVCMCVCMCSCSCVCVYECGCVLFMCMCVFCLREYIIPNSCILKQPF